MFRFEILFIIKYYRSARAKLDHAYRIFQANFEIVFEDKDMIIIGYINQMPCLAMES